MNKTLPLGLGLLITGVVATGVAAAWFMVAMWVSEMAGRVTQRRDAYENIYTTVTGEPVIVRTSQGNTQTTEKIVSLSGEPVKVRSQDLLHSQMIAAPSREPEVPTKFDWQ